MATTAPSVSVVHRAPASSSLYDVVDLILDKGLVIDAYIGVSLVGIELITINARVVIASVDTYLHWAEAVDRVVLEDKTGRTLPEFTEDMTGAAASGKVSGALEGATDAVGEPVRRVAGKVKEALPGGDDRREDAPSRSTLERPAR